MRKQEETAQPTVLGEQEPMKDGLASIGKSIVIKGELSGSEDLTIEGHVEGKIDLPDHVVTIGANGQIKAHIVAESIIIIGHVTGNLTATAKVDIKQDGSVEGDIVAPRVAIVDGSHFRGSIDMQPKGQSASIDRLPGVLKLGAKAPLPARAPVTDDVARV